MGMADPLTRRERELFNDGVIQGASNERERIVKMLRDLAWEILHDPPDRYHEAINQALLRDEIVALADKLEEK